MGAAEVLHQDVSPSMIRVDANYTDPDRALQLQQLIANDPERTELDPDFVVPLAQLDIAEQILARTEGAVLSHLVPRGKPVLQLADHFRQAQAQAEGELRRGDLDRMRKQESLPVGSGPFMRVFGTWAKVMAALNDLNPTRMDMNAVVGELVAEIPNLHAHDGVWAKRLSDRSVAQLVEGEETDFVDLPGVRCVNPEEQDPTKRIYLHIFRNKKTTWINHPDTNKNSLSDRVSELPHVGKDGYIERLPDGKVVCMAKGEDAQWTTYHGAECVNPDDAPEDRIYRRVFHNLKIYLPNEYEQAVQEVIGNSPNLFVPSMNGYSSIKPANERAWGTTSRDYTAACYRTYGDLLESVQSRYSHEVDLRSVDGASDMGVDRGIIMASQEMFCCRVPVTFFEVKELMIKVCKIFCAGVRRFMPKPECFL